jgi:hypothetical protein
MESPSSIHTRKEQQRLLTPHEYTGEALSLKYQDCISCGHRTEFTCIKFGYCYSCHWKVEQVELRDKLKDFSSSLSKRNEDDDNQKVQPQQGRAKDFGQRSEGWETLNVLGQPAEPMCTYYRCHHKFSFHGSRRCRCKHPTNKTLGIQARYI